MGENEHLAEFFKRYVRCIETFAKVFKTKDELDKNKPSDQQAPSEKIRRVYPPDDEYDWCAWSRLSQDSQ
jgi:hypothetical protein